MSHNRCIGGICYLITDMLRLTIKLERTLDNKIPYQRMPFELLNLNNAFNFTKTIFLI